MATDPERLRGFLADQNVPEEAKQQAAALYRQEQQAPGFGTAAAEMAGGTLGQIAGTLLPFPGGAALGSGAGTVAAGTAADLLAGRPVTLEHTAERGVSGTLVPPAVGLVARGGGRLIGAGARAVAERFPSFAQFVESVGPGVMRRAGKALKATGDLGNIHPEVVAERFRQWSDAMFDHVERLVGHADVIPTDAIGTAVAEHNIMSAAGLTPAEKTSFNRALSGPKISFHDARQIESGFGRLARKARGTREMGDAVSYQWSELQRAAHRDIESFLDPDAHVLGPHRPMQPGGQELKDALTSYREGQQAMRATGIYRRAVSPGGKFDPARFARGVKTLDDKGILMRAVGSERTPELRTLAEQFGKQTERTTGVKIPASAKWIGRGLGLSAGLGLEREAYQRGGAPGAAVPLGVAGTAAMLLHPGGRQALTTMAGQGTAQLLRSHPEILRYLSPDIDLRELGPR